MTDNIGFFFFYEIEEKIITENWISGKKKADKISEKWKAGDIFISVLLLIVIEEKEKES